MSPSDPNPGGEIAVHFTDAIPNTAYRIALVDSVSTDPGIPGLTDEEDAGSDVVISDDEGTIDQYIHIPLIIAVGIVAIYAYQQFNPSQPDGAPSVHGSAEYATAV